MKSKDLVPLIIVVIIAAIIAYVVSQFIGGEPESRPIDNVETITPDFPNEEDLKKIFSTNTIDTNDEQVIGPGANSSSNSNSPTPAGTTNN